MAYHRSHGVETRIVRIFNTYGPRCAPTTAGWCPTSASRPRGHPLTVYGDGRQTRSFCYVSDLVDGIVRLLFSAEVDPVNVGNPTEFTIAGLVVALERVLGRPLSVTYAPLLRTTPGATTGHHPRHHSPRLAPTVDLEAGLRETLAYFRTQQRE